MNAFAFARFLGMEISNLHESSNISEKVWMLPASENQIFRSILKATDTFNDINIEV